MTGKFKAIIAAAFCAALFASAGPDTGSDAVAGPVENSGFFAPNIAGDMLAAQWAPTIAIVQGFLERHQTDYNWGQNNARSEGWPYCDPACWSNGWRARSTNGGGVQTVGRAGDAPSEKAINRLRKEDRLQEGLVAKQSPRFPSPFERALPASKPILGCDPAFSSVADPARSHIFGRCMA
jgi:hypothetical protein